MSLRPRLFPWRSIIGYVLAWQQHQPVYHRHRPRTLTICWQVSSETGYDYLNLLLDTTTLQDRISGTVDWTLKTLTIPDGPHTITWQYSKDEMVSSGSDCGWVDKVVYTRRGGIAHLLPLLRN